MFLSGNGQETVKTVKINDKFEKINYTKWMIESRCLSHRMRQTSHELCSYNLEVRHLIYNNKTYAFNIDGFNDLDCIQIPLLVDEDGIVSAYQIALDSKYYEEFVKKYIETCLLKLGSGTNDDLKKLIIDFYNNIVEYGEAFPTKNMYWNMWHFDPCNFNDEYSSSNLRKARNNFNPKDLVKLIDNEKDKVYYGCLEKFSKEHSIKLSDFKCYLLNFNEFDDEKANEIICFKFFYPDIDTGVVNLLNKKKPRFEFKKADIGELNEEQKELYEIYKEHNFMR